jgi:hypothetical protein
VIIGVAKLNRIVVLMILWVASTRPISAQSAPLDYRIVSACYSLDVGDWNHPLGVDSIFHRLPHSVKLDTTAASRGGRVLTPDFVFPRPHHFPGVPRWQIAADTITMVWSDGFTPTLVWLRKRGDHLEGYAEARSDAIPMGKPNWPRASVTARRSGCGK